MEPSRHLVPAKEHNCHKSALHEKRHNALNGKRSTKYIADKPRVVAPVGTELKLQDNTRSNAHSEVDAKQTLPEMRRLTPERFSGAIVNCLDNAHNYCQAQCERHKQPMINCCKRKLGTRPVNECGVDCQ